MKKIAVIFGTRPEAIKLSPLIYELQKYPKYFSVITIVTAQHREMLDDVLSNFNIKPTYDLNVMEIRQSLAGLSSKIIDNLNSIIENVNPDLVIVQGDTTTTLMSSLISFYHKIPVAHVEAGLRTQDKYNPFPEEINRRLTSHIADLHFTPTPQSKKLLRKEGIELRSIFCSGNTVIDALCITLKKKCVFPYPNMIKKNRKIVLITMHRRENLGEKMSAICKALKELSQTNPELDFIFPVHRNPAVREIVFQLLHNLPNFYLIDPLNYENFVYLLSKSFFVITDSGGLQEEAPSLGKPVLVLRNVTERPEAVKYRTVKLVGSKTSDIVYFAQKLIDNKKFYKKMSNAVNPYGDGKASQRIVSAMLFNFGFIKKRPREFLPRDE